MKNTWLIFKVIHYSYIPLLQCSGKVSVNFYYVKIILLSQFNNWFSDLKSTYNKNMLVESLVNLSPDLLFLQQMSSKILSFTSRVSYFTLILFSQVTRKDAHFRRHFKSTKKKDFEPDFVLNMNKEASLNCQICQLIQKLGYVGFLQTSNDSHASKSKSIVFMTKK